MNYIGIISEHDREQVSEMIKTVMNKAFESTIEANAISTPCGLYNQAVVEQLVVYEMHQIVNTVAYEMEINLSL